MLNNALKKVKYINTLCISNYGLFKGQKDVLIIKVYYGDKSIIGTGNICLIYLCELNIFSG